VFFPLSVRESVPRSKISKIKQLIMVESNLISNTNQEGKNAKQSACACCYLGAVKRTHKSLSTGKWHIP